MKAAQSCCRRRTVKRCDMGLVTKSSIAKAMYLISSFYGNKLDY